MAIGVDAHIEARQTIAALERLGQDLDEHTMLTLVGQSLLNWIDRNFRAEGLEHKWAPLSLNTIAGRRAGRAQGVRFGGRKVFGEHAAAGAAKPLQDTGRLKQSFTSNISGDLLEVGTQSQIAEYLNDGTGPFTIRPKTRKALFFMTARGPVFRKVVHHPGIPARPMIPSDALTERIGIGVLAAEIQRITQLTNRGTA